MDTSSLQRSDQIRNRISNGIKNGVDRSSALSKRKRKGTIATSVLCEENKKTRPEQTTSLIKALPEELLVEILSLLPPKPFFCCRSVCKYWFSLCSKAFGSNKHLQPTVRGLFHNDYSYGRCFASFTYMSSGSNEVENGDGIISALPCLSYMQVLDCCNGLVLLSVQSKRPFINGICVYNPATQSLSVLEPLSAFQNNNYFCPAFSLAFDTRAPSQLHLMCFTSFMKDDVKLEWADIFSFEEGKCKCKYGKELVPDMSINHTSKGTFLDGMVHRLTNRNEILTIDPNNYSTQVIRLPYLKNLTLVKIGQSQGFLQCMSVCDNITLSSIWVLQSYTQQEWTMKYQLSLHQIYSVPQPYLNVIDVYYRMKYRGNFAFHPQQDVIFMPLGPSHLLTFDLSTSKGELHNYLGGLELCDYWVYMHFYSV